MKFFTPIQTGLGVLPAFHTVGIRSFPGCEAAMTQPWPVTSICYWGWRKNTSLPIPQPPPPPPGLQGLLCGELYLYIVWRISKCLAWILLSYVKYIRTWYVLIFSVSFQWGKGIELIFERVGKAPIGVIYAVLINRIIFTVVDSVWHLRLNVCCELWGDLQLDVFCKPWGYLELNVCCEP